jgi:hypothetical protein
MSTSDGNETIHHSRRPPLPEPDPPGDPPSSRRATVAILVAAALASVVAGYVTTTLVGGANDRASGTPGTATRTSGAPAPITRRPGGTLGTTQPPATTTPADPGTPVAPAPPSTAPSAGFDAPIPTGWREREFEVPKQGYLQSRWSDPRDSRTDVVIDWSDGDRRRPSDAAAVLRGAVAGRTDYREISFGPTRGKGWIWVYTLLDERGRRVARIDLISRHCGVLFAVLGTTPAKRFERLQSTFVAVSQGIRLKRRRC